MFKVKHSIFCTWIWSVRILRHLFRMWSLIFMWGDPTFTASDLNWSRFNTWRLLEENLTSDGKIDYRNSSFITTPWLMEPGGSMSHPQGLFSNPYELTKFHVLIPISLKSILILSSHLCLGLPKNILSAGVPVKNLKALLHSMTCPS